MLKPVTPGRNVKVSYPMIFTVTFGRIALWYISRKMMEFGDAPSAQFTLIELLILQ